MLIQFEIKRIGIDFDSYTLFERERYMSEKKGSCIIVAAGDLTVSEIQTGEDDFVIACDGGFDYCRVLSIQPDLVIGDFDSVTEESLSVMEEQIQSSTVKYMSCTSEDYLESFSKEKSDYVKLPAEKDDTDTLAAIRIGLKEGYRSFKIYGATGGRLEHTIANIQCLIYLKSQNATGYLCDGNGLIFIAQNETIVFQPNMEGYLSLFAMCEQAEGVTIKGLKYNMENGVLKNSFPIGISNEFIGEQAEVSVLKGTIVGIISY